MLDLSEVSTVRHGLDHDFFFFFYSMFIHQIICKCGCILCECAFSDQVLYIYVCLCCQHLAINIWLWHIWLHIPCSHVSTVQLSSIRTLWQLFLLLSSLSSLPTGSLLKKLKSLLFFWLCPVKHLSIWLHGVMKFKLSQESLIKLQSLYFAFLY